MKRTSRVLHCCQKRSIIDIECLPKKKLLLRTTPINQRIDCISLLLYRNLLTFIIYGTANPFYCRFFSINR